MKLGKLPAKADERDFKLSLVAPKLPIPPTAFGHALTFRKNGWGMLGNDEFGDCVFAGAAHEVKLLTKLGIARDARFRTADVLADYTAVTGFNPDDPSSDQGTDMREAASYRRKVGVRDSHGRRHKTGAYVWLDPGDWNQLRQALYVFTVVGIGIRFPSYAMDQFDDGHDWEYRGEGDIEGGHYVSAVGSHDTTHVHVVTWGRRIQMSREFYENFCDEAVVYVSAEVLSGAKKTPEGFDLAALNSMLAAL